MASALALLAGITPGVASAGIVPDPQPVATTPLQPVDHHTKVTLVTGDTVDYGKDLIGRVTVTLVPRPGVASKYWSSSGPNGDYVIPEQATAYVASGRIDRELFNVRYLAENGYGDDKTTSLPLIVSYPKSVQPSAVKGLAAELPAATPRRTLESLRAEGVTVDKAEAAKFWAGLTAGGKSLSGQVGKIMLDRKVSASLSESVPLIGAPEAWKSGYDGHGVKVAILDTGIDATHPDLAGRASATEDFTEDGSVVDTFGHGTHVASILGGTGAASGGSRKGVAPGADLLIGKVLDHNGESYESSVVDGMEWAAASGARVISMSLGTRLPAGADDPMAQAVDQLSASSGALFVIAAGNLGGTGGTIASPGSANSALTVGATSKTDTLADFSSRGPRIGDNGVKPEITGPGVGIVAARAAGTNLGPIVDDVYTRLDGTSMATPHVAGAAAIVAQRHPEWTGQQLKSALVASSKDNGFTVWQQGAGRVDVPKALAETVLAEPAALSAGTFSDPYTETSTQEITLANTGESASTLSLATSLKDSAGATAPAGVLTLDQSSLTIPAGGSAKVKVTINPQAGPVGAYSGRVVATGPDGHVTVVPVGFVKGPKLHAFTVQLELPAGLHQWFPSYEVDRVDDLETGPYQQFLDGAWTRRTENGHDIVEQTVSVPEGIYNLAGGVGWIGKTLADNGGMATPVPEITVGKDTTVRLRSTDAMLVDVRRPAGSEDRTLNFSFARTTQSGTIWRSAGAGNGARVEVMVTPTTKPAIGKFTFTHEHILAAQQVDLRLTRKGRSVEVHPLNPVQEMYFPQFPAGTTKLDVTSEGELNTGGDVRGKLVYANLAPDWGPADVLRKAIDAGAAGLLVSADRQPNDLALPAHADLQKIPLLYLDRETSKQVESILADPVGVSARVVSRPASPYEYKLRYYVPDRIPSRMVYPVDPKKLTKIDTYYHGEFQGVANAPDANEADFTFRPEDFFGFALANEFEAPTHRVEYYTQTDADVMWIRDAAVHSDTRGINGWFRTIRSMRGFSRQTNEVEHVNAGPIALGQVRPGPAYPEARNAIDFPCAACRQSDRMYLLPGNVQSGDETRSVINQAEYLAGLRVNDTDLELQRDNLGYPYYKLPAGAGRYELSVVYNDQFDGQKMAKSVRNDWTFTSEPPTSGQPAKPYLCAEAAIYANTAPCDWMPLIQPSLKLPLDLDNTAPSGRAFDFELSATHLQPTGAPRITSAVVDVSYDDGIHWQQAKLSGSNGKYTVHLKHPKKDRPLVPVSLRVELKDAAGNKVVQTLDRAYALR